MPLLHSRPFFQERQLRGIVRLSHLPKSPSHEVCKVRLYGLPFSIASAAKANPEDLPATHQLLRALGASRMGTEAASIRSR